MEINIATWNMSYWMHQKMSSDAWNYLINTINADISLVQEANPADQDLQKNFTWDGEIDKNRRWGSGVLTKGFQSEKLKFKNSYPGALVGRKVILPNNTSLSVFSLYGQLEDGYATTTLHRMLSDLTFLLVELNKKKEKVIIGGDFNASVQCDEKWGSKNCYTHAHRIFFERFEDFGLASCFSVMDNSSKYIRTHRHKGSKDPWQDDYLFVSRSIIDKVKSCKVIETPEVVKLSDHNPVVITLDI